MLTLKFPVYTRNQQAQKISVTFLAVRQTTRATDKQTTLSCLGDGF